MKYLGITLDCKLSFKQHIIEKSKKAIRILNAARNVIGKLWAPGLKQMKWIYETMVRPILTLFEPTEQPCTSNTSNALNEWHCFA